MQDHFLFNSEDREQCGVGCDRLGRMKDGLKYMWTWSDGLVGIKSAGQCCEVVLPRPKAYPVGKRTLTVLPSALSVVFWHDEYEASVKTNGRSLMSYVVNNKEESGQLVTRLEAQFKAEELLQLFKKYVKGL